MKMLITSSLIGSFDWYLKTGNRESFLNMLNKVFITNKYIENGINFEKRILEYTKNQSGNFSGLEKTIGNIVIGGTYQDTVKKEIEIDNKKYLLYGKTDFIKDNVIYDIKTANKYDKRYYSESIQHVIYMYCSGIKEFKYLINVNNIIVKICEFTKQIDDEIFIKNKITDLVNFINKDDELKACFNKNWECKY